MSKFKLTSSYKPTGDQPEAIKQLTEGIISGAANEILGTYEVEWLGEKIDLTPGWRRLTMVDAVKEYTGLDFGAITDDADAVKAAE